MSARASRFAFACGSFARNGFIGVRVVGGAGFPVPGAAAGRGATGGVDAGGEATETAPEVGALVNGAATPPLWRGAFAALGAVVDGPTLGAAAGRGATIGRAGAAEPCAAAPGIIGRGGKSTGRLTAPGLGAGPFGVGGRPPCFTTVGAGCVTGAERSGCNTAATELGAGVGARCGLGGGANVSASAVARP